MCSNFREGKEISPGSIAEYKIKDNKLIVYYQAYSNDSSFDEEIEINFCPMCGEDLR